MGKIKVLSLREAQKIAAGEVIERPANIVKELLENSIDAGSTHITITIKDSGKQLISITDNGHGMDQDDAILCFEQYATSKITHLDDLETINTFGFRGEALASIASVSSVQLITKQVHTLEGTRVIAHHGTIQNPETVGAANGTTITITQLFDTIPARKKFLKTRETELRAITTLFQAFCLANPMIHFTLISDDTQLYNHPPAETPLARAKQLWPQHHEHLLTLETTSNYNITGIISSHQAYKYDRSGMFFFVNQRWIKNHELSRALLKGYQRVMPTDRFPFASIIITLNPQEIDVNIHPRKEEVKFLHPKIIENNLQTSITQTLESHLTQVLKRDSFALSPLHPTTQPTVNYKPFNIDAYLNQVPLQQQTSHSSKTFIQPNIADTLCTIAHSESSIRPTEQIIIPQEFYTIIGQYKKTYILIDRDIQGLFIIDQHAAHERIIYESLSHKKIVTESVQLLFPPIITCNHNDYVFIEKQIPLFHEHGIVIEPFGNNQIIITSVPVTLKHIDWQDIINKIISWTHDNNAETTLFLENLTHELRAQIACKAAVKAGDTLSPEQMADIVKTLSNIPNRFTCPHGRPTGWLITVTDLEKKFKRIK